MRIVKKVASSSVIEPMLPLINIIFLLLIFFMVCAQIAMPITGVTIPSQSNEAPLANEVNSQEQWLFISKNGALTFQKKSMAFIALAPEFHGREEVILLADSEITTGMLNKVTKELNRAGVKKIRLVTQLSTSTQKEAL